MDSFALGVMTSDGPAPEPVDDQPLTAGEERFVRALVALLLPLVLNDIQEAVTRSTDEKSPIDTSGTTW